MFKIDGPDATANGEFKPRNPATGERATRVTYEWLNALQREIIAVITASGQTPNKNNDHQLIDAIQSLIAESGGGGGGGGGQGLTAYVINDDTSAISGRMYEMDSSGGSFDFTLPTGAGAMVVGALDFLTQFEAHPVTVYPAPGDRIGDGAVNEPLLLDVNRSAVIFYRAAGSNRWGLQLSVLGGGSSGGGSGGGGLGLTPVPISSAGAGESGKIYEMNSTAASFNFTLPDDNAPMIVGCVDARGKFDTHPVTVYPASGDSIGEGAVNEPFLLDIKNAAVFFYRSAGSSRWSVDANTVAKGGSSGSDPEPSEIGVVTRTPSGHSLAFKSLEEEIDLSGATTSSTIMIPPGRLLFSVLTEVIETITGSGDRFAIGWSGQANKFGNMAQYFDGEKSMNVMNGPGIIDYSPQPVIISSQLNDGNYGGSFSGGKVRVSIHYLDVIIPD